MPEPKAKTSVSLDREVYARSVERAHKLGISFSELVERALERDLKERMVLVLTEDGAIYTPLVGAKTSKGSG